MGRNIGSDTWIWNVGDFALHVGDEKKACMLMRLYLRDKQMGGFITEYIDQTDQSRARYGKGPKSKMVNIESNLLDPEEFGITVRSMALHGSHARLVLNKEKTQIRFFPGTRHYNIGDYVYIKEPIVNSSGSVLYYATLTKPHLKVNWRWQGDMLRAAHMPKFLARCFVQITDKRIERIGNISAEDSIKEGVRELKDGVYVDPVSSTTGDDPRHVFFQSWRMFHPTYSLEDEVDVIEFRSVY